MQHREATVSDAPAWLEQIGQAFARFVNDLRSAFTGDARYILLRNVAHVRVYPERTRIAIARAFHTNRVIARISG
jgi:hypothetical protein